MSNWGVVRGKRIGLGRFRNRGKPSLQVSSAGSANDMTRQRKKDRPEGSKVGFPGDGMGDVTFEGRDKSRNPRTRNRIDNRCMAVSRSQKIHSTYYWSGRWVCLVTCKGYKHTPPHHRETRSGTVANGCEPAEPSTVRNALSSDAMLFLACASQLA